MEELDKLDTKIRNYALIIIFVAIILLIMWVIFYINSPENASPLLMAIGIALLLGGILLLTRIQYVIWIKKRYK